MPLQCGVRSHAVRSRAWKVGHPSEGRKHDSEGNDMHRHGAHVIGLSRATCRPQRQSMQVRPASLPGGTATSPLSGVWADHSKPYARAKMATTTLNTHAMHACMAIESMRFETNMVLQERIVLAVSPMRTTKGLDTGVSSTTESPKAAHDSLTQTWSQPTTLRPCPSTPAGPSTCRPCWRTRPLRWRRDSPLHQECPPSIGE